MFDKQFRLMGFDSIVSFMVEWSANKRDQQQ